MQSTIIHHLHAFVSPGIQPGKNPYKPSHFSRLALFDRVMTVDKTPPHNITILNKSYFKCIGATQPCSECGQVVPNTYTSPDVTKIYKTIEAALTANNKTQQSEEALRIFENLLHEVDDTLHSHNYQVIRIVDQISDVCIEMGLWNKAIHYCKRSLDGYLKFYPKYHPSIAIQLFRIGEYLLTNIVKGDTNHSLLTTC